MPLIICLLIFLFCIIDNATLYLYESIILSYYGIFKQLKNFSARSYVFFGTLFYIVPIFIYFLSNSNYTPIGIPTLEIGDELITTYCRLVFIFFNTFILSSLFLSKLKLKDLGGKLKITFSQDFNIILLILFLITLYGYFSKIQIIQEIGYQNFHGGSGFSRRGYIEYFAEIFFILYLQIKSIQRSKFHIILLIFINFIFLLSGMRLPFFVNVYVLLLYLKPKIVTNIKFIIPSILLSVIVLILIQNYRYGFAIIDSVSNQEFLLNAFVQINDIFGYTTELCLAIINVKIGHISVGFGSPFYDFVHLYDLIVSKITGNTITISNSINQGNVGYNVYKYYMPDKFYKDNATFGGSNIGEVFYYYNTVGIVIYAIFMASVLDIIERFRQSQNNILNLIFLAQLPLILRSFRDGHISWLVNSSITLALYFLFLLFTLNKKTND